MFKISDRYVSLRKAPDSIISDTSPDIYKGLENNDIESFTKKGFKFYRGKVRDLLIKNDEIRIIHSDRLTAFDKFIGYVPYKGAILTAISKYWLEKAEEIIPTHLITQTTSRELLVEAAQPFKIEVIVRGYLAGSMARAYENGERIFCGQRLSEGLKTNQKLPEVIITPTTKAEVFEHDENSTPEELIKNKICSEVEWETIQSMALKLFELGREISESHGWILVDTKYEFGKKSNGDIILIDEAHTPDSSRFWIKSSYKNRVEQNKSPEMLDKELVRRWLMENGYKGEGVVPVVPKSKLLELGEVYLSVAETLINEPLIYG